MIYALADAALRRRVETALGGHLDADPAIHHVRDVAPNKRMLCISFRLPRSVAVAQELLLREPKRQRLESP